MMRSKLRVGDIAMAMAILLSAGCNANRTADSLIPPVAAPDRAVARAATPACTGSRITMAQCDVLVQPSNAVAPDGGAGPRGGFTPAQLEAAYKLPTNTKGAGQIVAIVDAYDNPDAGQDLAMYRSYFGLPAAHFTKFNQKGQTSHYPARDAGWGVEIDLDVQMVSASCPKCTIYLVEADSSTAKSLGAAEIEAVKLGAHYVSNSYSGGGQKVSAYDTPGVVYLASSGDYGFYIDEPAEFDSVVAVGGTSLYQCGGCKRGWLENVWDGSGAGCSTQPKPAWQHDPGCAKRTASDVSAIADPYTGVSEYDSFQEPGWIIVGGTSVSSPLLAGVFGLAGNAKAQHGGRTFWLRAHQGKQDLNPVTAGNDGDCEPTYLCTAGTGEYRTYSGPAGWGTPNGIGAF